MWTDTPRAPSSALMAGPLSALVCCRYASFADCRPPLTPSNDRRAEACLDSDGMDVAVSGPSRGRAAVDCSRIRSRLGARAIGPGGLSASPWDFAAPTASLGGLDLVTTASPNLLARPLTPCVAAGGAGAPLALDLDAVLPVAIVSSKTLAIDDTAFGMMVIERSAVWGQKQPRVHRDGQRCFLTCCSFGPAAQSTATLPCLERRAQSTRMFAVL